MEEKKVKKIIRIFARWILSPIIVPMIIFMGHWEWLEDNEIEYKWVWEMLIDYLLGE